MAQASKGVEQKPPVPYGGYLLVNHHKLHRAINGTIGRNGTSQGGVGPEASTEAILAEYDRLGGLIYAPDGSKLATGSFYDFEKRRPREVAEPKKASTEVATGLRESVEDDKGPVRKRRVVRHTR